MKKYNLKNNRFISRWLKRQNKQIVVLLGAGAAMPWGGVTTSKIKDIFIEDNTYKTTDGTPVGKYLFNILDEFYGRDCDTGANFETFIAVLEDIMNYIFNKTNEGGTNIYNTSYTSAIFDLKKIIMPIFGESSDKRVFSYELFRYYINLIIKEIIEYNKKIIDKEYRQHNTSLIAFTKYFLNRGYSVKYYTTNYDSLIPQILSPYMEVYEGLLNSTNSDKKFNFNLNKFRKARVSYFNLHGSIFNHKVFNGKYEIQYSNSGKYMPIFATMEGGNPSEPLFFSPIITGYNKTKRMINKPFNLGFSAFINDLNDCRGLLTVGYSFSDPHINSILSTFTSWCKANFVHVTMSDKDFNPSTSHEDFELDYYVTPISVKSQDDTWVYDQTRRKFIYKKGFEEFLKNNYAWKYLIPY